MTTISDTILNKFGVELPTDLYIERIYVMSSGQTLRPQDKDIVNAFARIVWLAAIESLEKQK